MLTQRLFGLDAISYPALAQVNYTDPYSASLCWQIQHIGSSHFDAARPAPNYSRVEPVSLQFLPLPMDLQNYMDVPYLHETTLEIFTR